MMHNFTYMYSLPGLFRLKWQISRTFLIFRTDTSRNHCKHNLINHTDFSKKTTRLVITSHCIILWTADKWNDCTHFCSMCIWQKEIPDSLVWITATFRTFQDHFKCFSRLEISVSRTFSKTYTKLGCSTASVSSDFTALYKCCYYYYY